MCTFQKKVISYFLNTFWGFKMLNHWDKTLKFCLKYLVSSQPENNLTKKQDQLSQPKKNQTSPLYRILSCLTNETINSSRYCITHDH